MVKITFHTFSMGDVEDPELYAGFPLADFMLTEKGRWIRANCLDPQYIVRPDASTFGNRVIVYGLVEERVATEYFLKWDKAE